MRNGDFSALLKEDNPALTNSTQLYDPENNFAPYVGNKGIPVINPVAKYLFAHPELYPLPNATPNDGIVQNNYQGTSRSYKANNQGATSRSSTTHARPTRSPGFYSMSTAYDGSTALLPVNFPGFNLYPSKVMGSHLGPYLLPIHRQCRPCGLYPHHLESGLAHGPEWCLRNQRRCPRRHQFPKPGL